MAPRSSKNLKTKESGTYDNLLEELTTKQKAAGPKFQYHGKSEEWTSEVWREVYNLLTMSPGGYVMKGKVQFIELQLLQVTNKHFQHNLLGFYHHAWAAITNPIAPTPDWSDAVEKTVSRQIKGLGVCNEATCLGLYLAHLYSHFHEMDAKEKEASKKHKALIQTVSDSDTEPEEKKEPKEEVPRVFCDGEASRSKPLDQKLDFAEWGNRVESLGGETYRLFKVFHVEIGSVTTEAVARNMKEMFAPPPVVETDLQPWK
ncbi:hypothetical protein R1flu_028186 [Riccia fluitans]|uniref:Uncharacterized protein n=1 Tax=Riccia fluitans TaxID=41844 RepID=A0ABD1XPZ7_9MARC